NNKGPHSGDTNQHIAHEILPWESISQSRPEFWLFVTMNASGFGLRAMGGCKPRQVWKEATVVAYPVCRGLPGAWRNPHVSGHRAQISSPNVRRFAEPG